MAQFYRLPAYDGEFVYGLRLLFGSAMVVSLLLGAAAIRRRDFTQHGAWMLRGYALGLGAGTQVLTGLVAAVIADPPTKLSRALLMGAGWVMTLRVGAKRHQPGGGRVDHPQAAGPSSPHRTSRCCPAVVRPTWR